MAPLNLDVPFTSKSKLASGALPTPRFPETLASLTVVTNPVLSIDSLVAPAVTSLIWNLSLSSLSILTTNSLSEVASLRNGSVDVSVIVISPLEIEPVTSIPVAVQD